MAQINIRIDDELKKKADALFNELGMSTTTAVTLFMKQTLREGGIPFKITKNVDPFYSKENQTFLQETIRKHEAGQSKPIVKTPADLKKMENE